MNYLKICSLFFLIFTIPTTAFCEIKGKVQDTFGRGISGVLVEIANSGFNAKTNSKGLYSIDYVPGKIQLIYSKSNYTTKRMELDIYTKDKFPAAPIEMWKIPSKGIYLVDRNAKKYVPIKQKFPISSQSKSNEKNYYKNFNPNKLYAKLDFFANQPGTFSINNGKMEIIDTYPKLIVLYKRGKGNLLLSLRKGMAGVITGSFFNGQVKENFKRIGDEKLLIRSFLVSDGVYVLSESENVDQGMGYKFTYPKGQYFPIIVGMPSSEPTAYSSKPQSSDSLHTSPNQENTESTNNTQPRKNKTNNFEEVVGKAVNSFFNSIFKGNKNKN